MTASLTTETSVPLSSLLRARTAAAHADAETSRFFADLAVGRTSRRAVAGLLVRLLPVYEALEHAARLWADDPVVGALVIPGLERTDCLRADVAALGVPPTPVTPATAQYVARVARSATRSQPEFVAHHYTRYLGDLSGGQVIRAALQRSLGLDASNGASFFVFDGLRPGQVKQSYRAALDALPFTADERERLIDESLAAYRLNTALARELDTSEIPS